MPRATGSYKHGAEGWTVTVTPDLDQWSREFGATGEKITRALNRVVDELAQIARRTFLGTVQTWMAWPIFRIDRQGGVDTIRRIVHTEDPIYYFVSGGTEERPIKPKNYPYLRFMTGYTPKTRPGSLRSYSGGPYGTFICVPIVLHHSITPRKFDEQVAAETAKHVGRTTARIVPQVLRRP